MLFLKKTHLGLRKVSARWIPCLLTNFKKKGEKKDCGLNCVENYLKSTKLAIDDVDRKLIQVIKH